ncbi:GEVED domain-containing protein [Streptococcus sp. 27098_8_109]|uniref:mucin-binding protein n=1 Tax=Streptococcus sp. 27098_8_109 TaxID=3003659 RepID=UPI00352FE424
MYKSKRQKNKSFDWYGLSQRFSIRKYHFGAASVLLGTALILGAAQTTAKAEEATTENKTEAVTPTSKDAEAAATPANVTLPATEATTGAPVLDKKELSEEEIAKLAAEVSKKDEKASETDTAEKTEVSDKEKATLTAPSTDKKVDKTVDEKADKKDEKKAENPITATKKILEQLTSEAEVLNTTAANYAEKKVEDKSSKEAIAAAVAAAKVEITASKKVLNEKDVTAEQLNLQLQRISSAIEAVYAEMKRAGHVGKVEAVLADPAGSTVAITNPINKVVVNNVGDITEEEARAIEKEIRTANPTLTAEDKIEVKRKGNTGLAVATVTLANGRVDQNGNTTHGFAIGDVAYGSAGEKNFSQLREAINWFDFATASITYADGTKVGPVEYVNNPAMVDFTSSKGRQERGRFTMVRTVLESTTHPELVGKKTNDPAFLKSGLAKYTLWKTYDHVKHEVQQGLSEGRFNNEIFEVLQEGMRFNVPTKVKGYTLSATVSSLSRKKVTTETYTLNKANGEPENINRSPVDGVVQREDVIVTRLDPNWSHLRLAGFETKYKDSNGVTRERLTAFSSAYDGGNVGVKFQLSATYNGRPVAVNAIAADSEDLSVAEFTQFESDGTPWEEFMRLNKNKTNSKGLFPNREGNGNFLSTFDRKTNAPLSTGYKLSEWTNKTETGYGSQLFGPFDSGINNGYDLPIGLTQNVENLGVYINANGSQSATIGFVIYDGGDAPASYGSAQHIIGNFNKEKDGKQVTATQPYLGDVPADSDFRTTIAEPNGAWVLDDLVNSEDYKEISLVSGSTQVTNSKGQSGTYLLDGKNPVIHMSDGTQVAIKNGEILSTANTLPGGDNLPIKGLYNQATRGLGVGNLPDEGEGQLLDPAAATKYTLRHASENEYILKGVKVNRGVNNDVAYVRGWVDFNGNGRFDLYESSELVTANADGTYDITFKNTPQLLNTSVDNLGVRLRVSVDKNDLRLPTGLASSGEVEDFVANVIHPPRGTRHETKDFQGKKQEVNFPTNAMFKASGKTIESNYKQWAEIDNNTAPKMVLNDTVVKSEEPTGKTVEVKDHLSQTIYNGTEVVVKDARGNTLGTAVKVTNKLTGKTEYYLSEYTEYDTAGNKVGVYKLNEGSAEGKNTTQGSLSFTKISFQPEAGFVGTAKGVAIRAWDDNGSHTGWEATEDTIKESLTSTTLAEKDKILENVNNGNNGAKSMDTSYIPTVIDVRPVGEDTTTEDVQGKPQSSNPSIPTKGTVETITNESVETSKRVDILNTSEKPTFATRKETPGKLYTEDTTVDKETTLTLTDGTTVTYKPSDKIPAGTTIANTGDVNVTGTGNVSVNNIRLVSGTLIPAGAKPQSNHPAPVEVKVTLANGTEQTIPAGEKIPAGATINTPFTNSANNTFDNVTYNTGQTIPRETGNKISRLANETSADQLVPKGESITLNGTTYSANKDVIPKGTRTAATYEDLMNVTLPNAVHLDPETGEVTSVPRRYTKVTDTEIVIENEGTYTLNQDTGEITFTPVPKFVGTGTGVTKQQPDVDYNDKVAGDPVTSQYGTDYGKATYTPIVKPQSKASITRTIHYVYENANDNPSSQDSYKDNDPIVAIDNTPVTRTQTIDYTRDYKIFSEAGETDKEMVTTNQVTDATGHVYNVGDTIPAGTKFNQGSIIIGKWTASSDENSKFKEIISPTVKGYTAEVVTANFTPNAGGKMGHIHNGKQRVGLYTPVADNTKDVGAYEPLVSEVRSDDKDDFDMYVVYKADTQKAKVTYIDLDATGDARILEVQNANPAPATGADAKTTYGVTTLQGKSHTKIPYTTAETIKKYEDLGYELVTDDFTNNTQGNPVEGGRKFDDDKEVDQAFNVYLRHKKVTRKIKDTQEVTRTIEYKYASTDDVPTDKRGTTAAPTVTETLHFERDRTIDYTLAAKVYPTEYATYKAVLDKSGYDSPEEYKARTVYYDHITNKAIAADATDTQKSIVTFGPWTPVGGTSNDAIKLSDAEKVKDDKFNLVNSPEVTGYVPDNATVEATAAIDAEADDYKITVLYTPVAQKAVVKFVEVDPTNTNKVITPGLADPVVVTGKSEAAYPATTATSVTDKIAELAKKGYELVNNGFVSTDKFDKDAAVDQEYVVKFKAKVVDIPSFDPTKPASNDNPKPTPGVTPLDPSNPDGPKWTEALINAVKVQEEVTRTIKYVYEDGTPVAESNLTSVADKKVKTLKFTRPGKINVATGEITYGDWSANQKFEAVTSPVLEKYTAAVAGVTPTTADVPEKTVAATDKDFEEVVVYKTKLITVDPKAPGYKEPKKDEPINPNDPNGPKWTDELLAKLKNTEEVTRTISYTYSTEASELNQAEKDGNKAGTNVADPFTTKVNYTRVAQVNPVTGEITYGEWEAKDNDTTLEGKAELPKVAGYVATGDVDSSKKDVTSVKAEDKDITEKVVYKALGKYVPVVPEGFTPPTIQNPQYPNSDDPSKPGDPTTTTTIPYVPGTTPVGPDGQPLTPKNPANKEEGYLPPAPTTPTGDTTIVYTKDGSQVAVTKFVDTTGKGLEPSVVDTGDTGKAFTKDADVTAAINKILARGYEKVANVNAGEKDYPSTDAEKVFDADASTNQEYTVTFKPIVKDIPTDPTTPGYVKPEPGQPVDPTKPDGPKWPESVKDLKTTESVTRTIKYVYENATPVEDGKLGTDVVAKKVQTLEFTRTAKVNLVTGEVEYGAWTPKTTDGFEAVITPTIDGYTSALVSNPTVSDVPAKTVTADAADYEEVVVYKTKQITIDPKDPNFDPEKPVDPKNPNGPKYKDLKLAEEVKRTITYTYADDVADTSKRGTDAEPKHETTVSFTRTASVNGVTGEITYSEWTAKDNDTTLEGKAVVPVKTGYVATGDVESSKQDVTGVNATDKDIIEKVIYKDLGKFVPVVPEGFTPPTIENPQYPNNPDDPTKPGTPTTTIPYVPGTTPVGPDGQPLTQKDPNDPTKGYNPPTPTNPTEDTTIVYTKDGSQVAVVHFIEVNSETDKTEKGGVAQSIVDTGDTGKAFTKGTEVTATIEALKAKGYTVVENNYPENGKFDADSKTNQEYKVLVAIKPVTVNPNDPAPTPDKPIDPNNPTGPKWTPELIKELEDGRKEEVKRTINYVYADGKKAADSVEETKEFKRSATINPVTGKITFGDWSPAQTFEEVTSPEIKNYTPNKVTVPASEVTATAEDINETVVYTTKPVTLDPSKPADPNTPAVTPKPEDKVPNDPKGRTYKELGLIEEVTHTVHYKLADGSDAGIPDNVQTLTFTRTADLDPVTGAISNFSDWKAKGDDTTIDSITTPDKPGYVASAAKSTARENVKATDKDSEETIIYRKLGSYVPVIPEGVTPPANTDLTPKPYPNDPNDPTKPGTPAETPVVPYIPGTTPVGPNGKPLTPKDPNDPTKGYEVPKVPEDPTQNTTITYVKDGSQVALVHFIKADGTAVHVSVAEAGDTGKAIKTTNVDNVKAELEAKGYEVVEPTDPAYTAERVAFYAEENRTFDDKDDKGDKGISQVYYVIVKEGITPIDPDKPLDPNNPNVTPKPGDKVPGDPKQRTYEQLGLLDEVNRTINYRYANTDKVDADKRGQEARPTVEQKLRYSRKGDLNKVTGEITYTSDWTEPQTLAEVTSPVIEGYVADIKAAEKVENVAHDAADSVVNVVYTPLGKYVPKVPEGFEVPNIDKPQYPNDPTDPTKPGTPTTPIPYVPGTTPKDPNGNPLKPVDPNDPSKGYVPPTPENPTEDTEITYEKDTQKAKVTYVVEGTGTVLHTDNLEGKSGEPIKYSTADKLADLKKLGYDLVTDGFTTATDKNYDKDTKADQVFEVTVKPHVEPLKPVDPENPNDPNKPKPGDPIDPNNPNGPKWTEDLIKKIDTTRHVNRTITYVNEKGEEVAKKVTDKVTFTREAKINSVTGEITYGNWTAKDGDTTFDKVESPVVKGYILKDAKQKEVAATTGLTADSKDENIEVVYTKLGSWIPKVPEGSTPVPPVTYPNDPKDPTKPGTDKPKVPYIPGTTPVVPKDPTKPISPDNPLVPLTPVDPNDPTKGYEVPPVPTDPGTDTRITYVTDKQKAITNFVDEKGKVVSTPVIDEGDSGANFTKSKVDEVTKTIEKLEKAGYRVVNNNFPSKDTDRVFDKDKSVDQKFTVTVAERIIPVTPGKPVDPNDPNLPKNPDGTPITPSKPEPGKPVFPNDPNSPVWPDSVKDMVTEKAATRTIKYVDRDGKEVSETRTETIKFTREAKVNLVTGVITYGKWTTDRNDDIFNGYPVPVVKGYIAKAGDLESSTKDVQVTPDTIKDINETVIYDKLGSWIPNIPGTPTNPITYPNDPKDPTKPGTDKPKVPYVPGFIPVDPNGNPLKPVDPNDPTKGYEVPDVPADPTQDTPIKYIPVHTPNNGGGNNGGGGGNIPTPQPQPNPAPAPQPEPSPAPNPVPVTPETPEQPVVPVTPEQTAEPATPQYMDGQRELPNTGTEAHSSLAALGLLGALSGFGLIARKKRKDEE